MNKKLLSLFALITLTVGIAIAVNDVPDNGLKFAGNSQEAEPTVLRPGQMAEANLNVRMKERASQRKSSDAEWGDWEAFAPGGSNDATWTLTAWQPGKFSVKTYVRTCLTDPTRKQIKCEGWGAGVYTVKGVDILMDWDTTDNSIEIPMQSTGYYIEKYEDDCVLGTFKTGTYDPEQGRFKFLIGYSVPEYYVLGGVFGSNYETLQMDGEFKDYSLHFTRGNVDDSTSPVKQTINVVNGKDNTSFRVHVDTYENYAAAKSPARYLEAMAKADGEDYTGSSATVELKGSVHGIYVVVVSVFANGEMKEYDYGIYEVHPDTEWESIGMRPYRDDIVTSLYNMGVTGPVYEVEIQKHKTYRDIYRIKNPYGHNTPFSEYTTFENAYIYINAQDHEQVITAFWYGEEDLGIDIKGGAPVYLHWYEDHECGTYDGYAISFPPRSLESNGYNVNTRGLFRAVINFKDPELSFEKYVTSVLTGETAKIISENTFVTPTFESLTPEIATVDAKGVVTGIAPGTAKIKVTQDAMLEFNAADTTMEITVRKNEFVYGNFIFNTDEGLAALGIAKPAPSGSTMLGNTVLKNGVVEMSFTDGIRESQKTRIANSSGVTDLRIYQDGGSFTVTVPEGYSLVRIDFTGKTCNMFGHDGEFSTYTKSHSVWDAPIGAPTKSKTFEIGSTTRFDVIQVKVNPPSDPSGINDVSNGATVNAEGIYNLQGQKVSAMHPGSIYIVNGKKVIAR